VSPGEGESGYFAPEPVQAGCTPDGATSEPEVPTPEPQQSYAPGGESPAQTPNEYGGGPGASPDQPQGAASPSPPAPSEAPT
jgi:hypothetical protein